MADNSQIIRSAYEAFARGDVGAVLGVLDPNIEWTDAAGFPTAGTYRGHDAVVQGVFMPIGTYWEGFSVAPDSFVSDGDAVVAVGTYSGKAKSTGKSMTARFAHVWKLRDGKAVNFEQIVDSHPVQQALG